MELTKELVSKIKKEYNEWLDDCELHNLPLDYSTDGVFDFILHYIDKEENNE